MIKATTRDNERLTGARDMGKFFVFLFTSQESEEKKDGNEGKNETNGCKSYIRPISAHIFTFGFVEQCSGTLVISRGTFNILSGSRKVSPIAFPNIARTRETICWSAADICSLRNISQLNVEIDSFFRSKVLNLLARCFPND
jgi:hypothetical protein